MTPVPEWRAHPLIRPDLTQTIKPYVHDACQRELDALYRDRLAQALLKKQTEKRLKFFVEHKANFLSYREYFELIGSISDGYNDILYYSLRYNGIRQLGNLRILFILLNDIPFFIHAFKEQKDSSYDKAKEVLRKRLMEEKPNGYE